MVQATAAAAGGHDEFALGTDKSGSSMMSQSFQ
jgi:hypothetical protein